MLDSTPFATSVVLYSLGFSEDPLAHKMRDRAVEFLKGLMEPGNVWSYWTRKSGKRIVPDLDDTSCISKLLMEQWDDKRFPDANRELFFARQNEQGWFYTWFEKKPESNDVDSVVNANVVWYLGETAETLRTIQNLQDVIKAGSECSSYWYYQDPLALYYAISRAGASSAIRLRSVFDVIHQRISDWCNRVDLVSDSLSLGVALSTLGNLGVNDTALARKLVDKICSRQGANGAWETVAYYGGPEPPGPQRVWFGSEEVTTAFCLEGLLRSADV